MERVLRTRRVRYACAIGYERSGLLTCNTSALALEPKGPIIPPTREWTWLTQNPRDLEWAYVMFDWDNYFSSYIAGLDPLTKNISYSNLIQITKVPLSFSFSFRPVAHHPLQARASLGMVPNWAAGGV